MSRFLPREEQFIATKSHIGGRNSFRGIELYIFGLIRKIAKSDS
jgi:hypothetical protein